MRGEDLRDQRRAHRIGVRPSALRRFGFGQPVVDKAIELAGYGLKGLKDARARHRDGNRRVAINLDASPAAGTLKP